MSEETMVPDVLEDRSVGVAVSGGGHRAALWALGVLLYLVDAGVNRRVRAISSVSGGSITNGAIARHVDYRATDSDAFDTAVTPLARVITTRGLFNRGPTTDTWLLTTVAMLGLGILLPLAWLGTAVVAGAGDVRQWLHWAGLAGVLLLVLGLWSLSRRSVVVERALAREVVGSGRLADVTGSVDHVFCATDLQSGRHVYLAPDFVYAYDFGAGRPGPMSLARAVQCSACLPGAFAPRVLPTAPYQLAGAATWPAGGPPDRFVLVDGGVYDNMADQWLVGMPDRARLLSDLGVRLRGPVIEDVVIANAGGVFGRRARRGLTVPGLGDVRVLKLVSDVMYAVTTTHRRQQFIRRSQIEHAVGAGQRGGLIHISQTPWTVAEAFDRGGDAIADRARAVLGALRSLDRPAWTAQVRRSVSVPTTLGRLGMARSVDVLEHAYLLAMCNLHVLLGYPLLTIPDRARFTALCDNSGL